jgi:hypothetical protein
MARDVKSEYMLTVLASTGSDQSDPGTEVLVLLAAGMLVGLVVIYYGFKTYRVGRLIKNTPTEKVRSAAVGRTELNGTAVPKDFVMDRPFTDGKCLYASYKVREYREYNDDNKNNQWRTVFSKTLAPPFYLDDGTGEMLVDADPDAKFEISDSNSTTIRVGEYGNPPEMVQEFLAGPEQVQPSQTELAETMTDLMGGVIGGFTAGGHAQQTLEQAKQEVKAEQAERPDPRPEASARRADGQRQDGESPPQITGTDGSGQADVGDGGTGSKPDGESGKAGGGATGEPQGEAGGLDIAHVSRGDLNRHGNVLQADERERDPQTEPMERDGAETSQIESEGANEETSGLLSSVRGTVDTVTDMVEAVSGTRAVSGSSHRKRRYIEEVLPVGADAYVYGNAQPQDTDLSAANEDRLVMREDRATEQFIISDFSEDEISRGYTKRAVLFIIGGLILSAGCLGGLAYLLGL